VESVESKVDTTLTKERLTMVQIEERVSGWKVRIKRIQHPISYIYFFLHS
jgi:hypothetical protein